MKKLYSSALSILLITSLAAQPGTEYFEGPPTFPPITIQILNTPGNVWQIGKPNKPIFDSSYTLPNAIVTDTVLYYPPGNTSAFELSFMPWFGPGYAIMAIHWMQKIDFDQGFDGGIIEFSSDNGNTFQNAFNNPMVYNFYGFQPGNEDTLPSGEFCFSGRDTTWRNVWLCFSAGPLWMVNQDSFKVRFTLRSDTINTDKEGWMIDNFFITWTFAHTIKEHEQLNYLDVYPNPSADRLYLEAERIQGFHIIEEMELVNALGEVVDKWTNIPTKYWIDTRKYPPGLYHLRVRTNIKTVTTPVSIVRTR